MPRLNVSESLRRVVKQERPKNTWAVAQARVAHIQSHGLNAVGFSIKYVGDTKDLAFVVYLIKPRANDFVARPTVEANH